MRQQSANWASGTLKFRVVFVVSRLKFFKQIAHWKGSLSKHVSKKYPLCLGKKQINTFWKNQQLRAGPGRSRLDTGPSQAVLSRGGPVRAMKTRPESGPSRTLCDKHFLGRIAGTHRGTYSSTFTHSIVVQVRQGT